ncbi:MAG: VCBS repeat-containing protein, partial [Bacteroidia bacterium]|nr:VCBS repeat-containing protein [Bacteroidia bacterium]
YYPIHLREEMAMQTPIIKKRALKYADYAKASMNDLFSSEIMAKSIIHKINEFRSGIFYNNNGQFTFEPLPKEVQYSDQKAVWIGDIDNDGWHDLVVGGNQHEAQPHIGINAASYGHVLINDKTGRFMHLSIEESGFLEKGQIRDIESIHINGKDYLCVVKNNQPISFYLIK